MKKIAVVFGVMVLLIAGGLLYLHSNLDSIVKAAIEKYGTQAAHSDVRVDSVKISISSGEGSLNGLTVNNPSGFSSAKALALGIISVKLDTSSVTGNGPIIIKEIVIDGSQIHFEANNTGDSNLQALDRNATANAPAADKAAAKQEPARKIIINDLYIRNSRIDITHPLLQGKALTASLPEIHLSNIGKDNGGASPAQVADLVLKNISSSATRIATSDLMKNIGPLKDIAKGAGGNLLNSVGGLLGK